jgi:hypothetical protein
MSADKLRSMIEAASEAMTKWFDSKQQIRAMWHAVKRNGEHLVVPVGIAIRDKDVMAATMRALFKEKDVVRCVFIDEAWVATAEGQEDMHELMGYFQTHGTLEHHPSRIEIVVFQGEDAEAGVICAQRRIIRAVNSRARLGPLEWEDNITESQGRFVGMLPQTGKAN